MNKQDVLKIIAEISGCDASDDYAKGWDDALKEVERRIEMVDKEKDCTNCLLEYSCDWSKAGEEKCCEDWKSEEENNER